MDGTPGFRVFRLGFVFAQVANWEGGGRGGSGMGLFVVVDDVGGFAHAARAILQFGQG